MRADTNANSATSIISAPAPEFPSHSNKYALDKIDDLPCPGPNPAEPLSHLHFGHVQEEVLANTNVLVTHIEHVFIARLVHSEEVAWRMPICGFYQPSPRINDAHVHGLCTGSCRPRSDHFEIVEVQTYFCKSSVVGIAVHKREPLGFAQIGGMVTDVVQYVLQGAILQAIEVSTSQVEVRRRGRVFTKRIHPCRIVFKFIPGNEIGPLGTLSRLLRSESELPPQDPNFIRLSERIIPSARPQRVDKTVHPALVITHVHCMPHVLARINVQVREDPVKRVFFSSALVV